MDPDEGLPTQDQEASTAPEMPQETSNPSEGTPVPVADDLTGLVELVGRQANLVGYSPAERLNVLDMWVTSTIADLGQILTDKEDEQWRFANTVVASRLQADLDYLLAKPPMSKLVVPT